MLLLQVCIFIINNTVANYVIQDGVSTNKENFPPDISCEYRFLRASIKGVTFPVRFTAGLRVAVK